MKKIPKWLSTLATDLGNKDAEAIQLCSSLDCCKDKDCPLCKGTGYIVPNSQKKEKVE